MLNEFREDSAWGQSELVAPAVPPVLAVMFLAPVLRAGLGSLLDEVSGFCEQLVGRRSLVDSGSWRVVSGGKTVSDLFPP